MLSQMTKYSIIIPHKNIPKRAKRCVDSIPDKQEIQIIIVDDGSNQSSLEELGAIIKERKNVLLVKNQCSMGAGAARNIGLQYVTGEWVLFADADDFYHEGLFEFLNDHYDSNSDLIFFNADSIKEDTGDPSWRADHVHDMLDEYGKDKNRGELKLRYLFGAPWCKMVKLSIILNNHIKFDETKIRNDVRFSYLVGFYAKEIEVDKRTIYCYVDRPGSLSKTVSIEKTLDEFKVFSQWYYFIYNHTSIKQMDRFDYAQYKMSQDLYKRPSLYVKKFMIMKGIGFSTIDIISYTIKNLMKTVLLKIKSHE